MNPDLTDVYISIYLYIYIYIYGHNLNQWAKKRSRFQFVPNFIVKNDREKPPHLVWGFSCFNVLSSFSSLPFLP